MEQGESQLRNGPVNNNEDKAGNAVACGREDETGTIARRRWAEKLKTTTESNRLLLTHDTACRKSESKRYSQRC